MSVLNFKCYYTNGALRILSRGANFTWPRSYCEQKKPEAEAKSTVAQPSEGSTPQLPPSAQLQTTEIRGASSENPDKRPGKSCDKESGKRRRRPRRTKWCLSLFFGGLCSAVLWAIYKLGKPETNQSGQDIEDELSTLPVAQQYLQRMWLSMQYYQKMVEEPLPTKLLPDVVRPPYIQPRYTLVLEMKDVLVHPDWTYQTGWRFKKRPGVDYFLHQCSKHFEIVVYTGEQGMTAFPILDALDPWGYIRYRLVRGATQFVDGHHIKCLERLNRSLKRVIVVDWDLNAMRKHLDNTFAIARWLGNDDDVQLFDLVAFLQIIAEHEVDDVREVLHYYRQFEDPLQVFKENQRKLLEQTQEKSDAEPPARSFWPYRYFMGSSKR